MARPIVMTNNRMLVALNRYGLVHDLHYPYLGLENHTASPSDRNKVGVWVDNKFSWLDDDSWEFSMDFLSNTLVGFTKAENKALGVILEFQDFVAINDDVFFRRIHVINNNDRERQISLFMHQVMHISESFRGDTALYLPESQVILDYKGRRAFAIYAEDQDKQPFDQYSIGNFGIEGKEGTFKDAEDGELSGNNVEHGQVDSVLRIKYEIEGYGSRRANYWITAAQDNTNALELHEAVRDAGVDKYFKEAIEHWHQWLAPAEKFTENMDEKDKEALLSSLILIKSHTDERGAVIASCDSQMLNYSRDYYNYCWPRDAAYNLMALVDFGYFKEAKAFFSFMKDVLTKDGYLMHKYLSDKSEGSSWHPAIQHHHSELPIQEDETAIVLLALFRYYEVSKDISYIKSVYNSFIVPACDFLATHIDEDTRLPHPSYDLWEEKFLTTTYTTAVAYATLKSASDIALELGKQENAVAWDLAADDMKKYASEYFYDKDEGYLIKGFIYNPGKHDYLDKTLDVSTLYGVIEYGLFDINSEEVQSTLKKIEEKLIDQAPIGGVPRYEYDHYNSPDAAYKGNPWLVTTLWMAQLYKYLGKEERARELLDWSLDRRMKSGILPEQLNPVTAEYVSVAPLIWSQAELVRTIDLLNS